MQTRLGRPRPSSPLQTWTVQVMLFSHSHCRCSSWRVPPTFFQFLQQAGIYDDLLNFSRQAGGDNPIFNWIFDLFGNLFSDTQPVQTTSFNRHKLLSLHEAKVLDIFGRRKKRRSIGTSCFFRIPKKARWCLRFRKMGLL